MAQRSLLAHFERGGLKMESITMDNGAQATIWRNDSDDPQAPPFQGIYVPSLIEENYPEIEFLDIYDSVLLYLSSGMYKGSCKERTGKQVNTLDQIVRMNEIKHLDSMRGIARYEAVKNGTLKVKMLAEFHYLYTREQILDALNRLVSLNVAREVEQEVYSCVHLSDSAPGNICRYCGRRIPQGADKKRRQGLGEYESFVHPKCAEEEKAEKVTTGVLAALRSPTAPLVNRHITSGGEDRQLTAGDEWAETALADSEGLGDYE
jgi:hypothetical protein